MADIIAITNDSKDASSPSKDKLFDPSVDMLVNDFDDERTLEEEEALAAGEDPHDEISSLQKESSMPIEELLALYGVRGENQENESPLEEDYQEQGEAMEHQDTEPEILNHPSQLRTLYEPARENDQDPSRLLRSDSRISEEEEDYDYSPDEEEWKKLNKTIMVGSDYQAVIPEGLRPYNDSKPYQNDDKLLWDPISMSSNEIEEFLQKASALNRNSDMFLLGPKLRDDEQALYLLQQCGHNTDQALLLLEVIPSDTISLWTEEECRNFESGIRVYGKNFHLIQQHKVKSRTVGELVQFYYLWKKSERHDIFANKTRLEKKKYTLHPGLTDFMDRFLEDQDGRDRSSSPNVQFNSDKKNDSVPQTLKDS